MLSSQAEPSGIEACLYLHLLVQFSEDEATDLYYMAYTLGKFEHSYKAIRERASDHVGNLISLEEFKVVWGAICTPAADAVFAAHS